MYLEKLDIGPGNRSNDDDDVSAGTPTSKKPNGDVAAKEELVSYPKNNKFAEDVWKSDPGIVTKRRGSRTA